MSYKTLADCLYAAQEDYDANRDIIGNNPEFEVTVEDVQIIKDFFERRSAWDGFDPKESKVIAKMVLAMYEKLNK